MTARDAELVAEIEAALARRVTCAGNSTRYAIGGPARDLLTRSLALLTAPADPEEDPS